MSTVGPAREAAVSPLRPDDRGIEEWTDND